MSRYLIMSDLATAASDVVDTVRTHEDRWDEHVREKGITSLIKDQMGKWQTESTSFSEREHRAKEMAAVFLYAYVHMKEK